MGPGGRVAQLLSGYEPRPQQIEMACVAAEAFAQGGRYLIEAGTGVGKSFAYLIPAIDHVLREGGRVVISTHTIALQEQLIQKDIPFLKNVFAKDFSAELVKGRGNYIGLRRLARASSRQGVLFETDGQLAELHAIEDWAYEIGDGSLSDLARQPSLPVWDRVRSDGDDCMGRKCPHYQRCFYQRARRRANGAQLLIVNHALLFSDLALRQQQAALLPDYECLVLDEAHTVENVAGEHLGLSLANSQLRYVLNTLYSERTGRGTLASLGSNEMMDVVRAARKSVESFFDEIGEWRERRPEWNGRLIEPPPIENTVSARLIELHQGLRELRSKVKDEQDQSEVQAYSDRCKTFASTLRHWHEQLSDGWVYWIETEADRRRRVTLAARPIDVGPTLKERLFDRMKTVILTSATLTTARRTHAENRRAKSERVGHSGIAPGHDPSPNEERRIAYGECPQDVNATRRHSNAAFEYLRGRLGLEAAATMQLGSPFDYQRQMRVYVEAGLPDPGNPLEFVPSACDKIRKYLLETHGRAFVLFTSYDMLQRCAERLADFLEEHGMPLLVQGGGLPRTQMLDRFRSTPRSVLFGTDTFWAGVDVPGEALSNVIIVKLPFASPGQPIVEAQIEKIRRSGGNPFYDFQLPEAILKFRQGIGRLIRTRTDRGIVVILDPRVVSKPYGKQFLKALPECEVVIEKG